MYFVPKPGNLIFSASGSMTILKIKGTCLVPLLMLKGLDSMEEKITRADGCEQSAIIAE